MTQAYLGLKNYNIYKIFNKKKISETAQYFLILVFENKN